MKSLTQDLKKIQKSSSLIAKLLFDYQNSKYKLNNSVINDIKYRIRAKLTTGDALAKETGIQRTTISHVLSGRRKFTEEQIEIYIDWLREGGF